MTASEGSKDNYNPGGKNHYSTQLKGNTKVKEKLPEEHGTLGDPTSSPKCYGAVHSSRGEGGKGGVFRGLFHFCWVILVPLND